MGRDFMKGEKSGSRGDVEDRVLVPDGDVGFAGLDDALHPRVV